MNEIQKKIIAECCSDDSQINIIISTVNKLLVEAPAGYGKTRTLLFKAIFILSKKDSSYKKKILIVTFTNNGISKLNKDLDNTLNLLNLSNKEKKIYKNRIEILNFHSLSKKILSKYGYVLNKNLKNIHDFDFLNEKEFKIDLFKKIDTAIKTRNLTFIKENYQEYVNNLIDVSNESKLPYSGVFFLLMKLFEYNNIKLFYQNYYEYIFIDEYQDSNILALITINLINDKEKGKRYLFGDSLQNIFEFNGANPQNIANSKKDCKYFSLSKNYRFRNNKNLKSLEKEFRNFYFNKNTPEIKVSLYVNSFIENSDEGDFILNKNKIKGHESSVVILGNRMGNLINPRNSINVLSNEIFFNCLFEEENDNDKYITFSKKVLEIYKKFEKEITTTNFNFFYSYFEDNYKYQNYLYEDNYIYLLKEFIQNYLMKEIYYLNRKEIFLNVLNNNDLIKFIEYVKDKVPIITIHKAKGLEWDNVFIANMNQNVLSFGKGRFLEKDLRLYYVAITRAKKNIYFSLNSYQPKSEFFNLPFLEIIQKK